MKYKLLLCMIFLLLFSNICSADVYTTRISNLNAEKLIQKYNNATYKEHEKMNYFVEPELSTPKNWGRIWPYDLWKSVSIDSKYHLEITTDKQGYVTKIEIICAYDEYKSNAIKIIAKMLATSTYISEQQINYIIKNIKAYKGKNNKKYYNSTIVINNKTTLVLFTDDEGLNVVAFGRSPYD